MTANSEQAPTTHRRMARRHPEASSGERASWEILRNVQDGTPVDFAGCFVRLGCTGKRAVVQLLIDLSTGGTGLGELT